VRGDLDPPRRLGVGRPDLPDLPGDAPRRAVDLTHHRDLLRDAARGGRDADDRRPRDGAGPGGQRDGDTAPFRVPGKIARQGKEAAAGEVVRVGVVRPAAEEEPDADPGVGARDHPLDPAVVQQDREGADLLHEQFAVLPSPGKKDGKDALHGQIGKRPGRGQGSLLRLFR